MESRIFYFVEIVVSLILLFTLVLLRWERAIEEKTFLIGMVIWALITPSPQRWLLVVGNWLRAQKNGGFSLLAGRKKEGSEGSEEAREESPEGNSMEDEVNSETEAK